MDKSMEIASKCDMILPGIGEGEIHTGSSDPEAISGFYLNLGAKTVIVKLGGKGVFVKTKVESHTVPGDNEGLPDREKQQQHLKRAGWEIA